MRKNIVLLLFLTIIVSCNSRKIDGVYYYEENKDKHVNLFTIGGAAETGRNLAGSIIGKFEFKNGKCYLNIMGIEQKLDYEIEDSVIYLGSNALNSAGIGLRIIDANTLLYANCVFRKMVENDKNSAESPNVNVKRTALINNNETYKKLNSKERLDKGTVKKSINIDSVRHDALIKDIISKDGEIYIVLDYIKIIDDYGAYKNENPQFRTFRLGHNCEIQNCRINIELTFDNIITYRNELISTKNSKHQIICHIEGNLITSLNFGCWG
jgi:hypothetical protein